MARYKPVHTGLKLLAVDFDRQVLPGSFEHALCHLVDHELDLGLFHARYQNDDSGAPAFDPAALIKIVLLAYSRGIIGSRKTGCGAYIISRYLFCRSGTADAAREDDFFRASARLGLSVSQQIATLSYRRISAPVLK